MFQTIRNQYTSDHLLEIVLPLQVGCGHTRNRVEGCPHTALMYVGPGGDHKKDIEITEVTKHLALIGYGLELKINVGSQ